MSAPPWREAPKEKRPRCSSCGLQIYLAKGEPAAGQHTVCFGCRGFSRFSDDCRLLLPVSEAEVNALPAPLRLTLVYMSQQVQQYWGDAGRPPGFSWRRAALCTPCWQEFRPGRAPVIVHGGWEVCAFCEIATQSGIYCKLLIKDRMPAAAGAAS